MMTLLAIIYCGSESFCDLPEAQLVTEWEFSAWEKTVHDRLHFLSLEIGTGFWSSVSAGDISISEPSGSAGTSPVS